MWRRSIRRLSIPSQLYSRYTADPHQLPALQALDQLTHAVTEYIPSVHTFLQQSEEWKTLRLQAEQKERQRRELERAQKQLKQQEEAAAASGSGFGRGALFRESRDKVVRGDVVSKMLSWGRIMYATRKVASRSDQVHETEEEEYALQPEELPNAYYGLPEPPQCPAPPKGLYLHGNVGVGKSMLMDLFFEAVRLKSKHISTTRIHFHSFMLMVHQLLHQFRMEEASESREETNIEYVAKCIAGKYGDSDDFLVNVLCFDEFQINDIVDAVLLKGIFEELFLKHRTIVVITGNRPPDQLNRSHLRQEDFIEFLEHLSERCTFVELRGSKDYRAQMKPADIVHHYLFPLNESNKFLFEMEYEMRKSEENHVQAVEESAETIELLSGRKITIPRAIGGIARFTFDEICGKPLGAADYMAIASRYHTIFISGIPQLSEATRDTSRRLITLIDELYNHRCKLICTAQVEVDQLFVSAGKSQAERRLASKEDLQFDSEVAKQGSDSRRERYLGSTLYTGEDEAFAFARAASRLKEMQSQQYIDSRLK